MRKIFKRYFAVNIIKKRFFKKKEESIKLLLRTWLQIVLGETYACAKDFRKETGLRSIKRFGVINLENEPAEMAKACHEMKKDLALDRAEHRQALVNRHRDTYKLSQLLKLRTKEDVENVPKQEKFIPELEFEKVDDKDVKLSTDRESIIYEYHFPKRDCPKQIMLVSKLGADLHDLAIQKASIMSRQLKRGIIKPLQKVKERNEDKETLDLNILGYANSGSALFIKFWLYFNYICEFILLQNIFHYNLGLGEIKAWIVSGTIVGATYVISRRIFNHSERLVRTIKQQWWIISVFCCVFFAQITASGMLANYNIQHKRQVEALQADRIDLAFKQGELEDVEDEVEKARLEEKIAVLKADIKRRSDSLKVTPFWTTYMGFVIVAFTSVLTLFFTTVLKALSELYSHASKLKKSIKKSERIIAEKEELYPEKVKNLLSAYDKRHLLCYYVSKKHILEQLIAQEDDLDTDSFFNAYNINNNF